MPISFHAMVSKLAQISVRFMEEDISITYYPGKVTEEFIGASLALQSMEESTFLARFHTFNQMLCEVIARWDVFEDDACTVMYELTPDKIQKLPWMFRADVSGAILSDMRPEITAVSTQN